MGSCSSRSSTATTPADLITAQVVDLDGSMAQFAAPVTAREALDALTGRGASRFISCSDELLFDTPVRALGAHDALQAGQLYFALPLSMLRRPLSGQDMAALVARASSALGAAPVVVAVDDADDRVAGVSVSPQDKNGGGSAVGVAGKQRHRRRQTGRVAPAPIVVVSGDGSGDCERNRHVYGGSSARKAAVYGGQTVGKTRNGARYAGGPRRLSEMGRLGVIVEEARE